LIDEKTSKLKILSFWDFLISSRQRDRPSGALQENLFPVFKLFPFPIQIEIEIEIEKNIACQVLLKWTTHPAIETQV
jgi:hypothetical protein